MNLPVIISIILVSVFLVFICIFSISKNYRKLSKLQSIVKESYSTLEIFLDKRTEIISKMVDLFEPEDIKKAEIATILNIFTQLKNNQENNKRFSLEASLTTALDGAENVLKNIHLDDTDFIQLVLNCNYVQDDLKRARNYYNNNVEAYNKKLNSFPANIAARLFKFKKEFYIK